jgi:NAD(P)-dependent dehydrogenase (short-subunit alcohol dehydrogenase family)
MQLAGKVMVVTGGGNGIGRAVVLELLRRQAKVAAVDIRRQSLDETADMAAAGDRLATFEADITDRAAIGELPEKVTAAFGAVDGIVNVAGIIQPFERLEALDYGVIQRVINVNLYGTIHINQAFLPYLRLQLVAHIANVSSMGGFLPVPGQTVYGASKAAVKLLTEGLYAELLDTKVGVSVIMPGAVATEITSNSGVQIPGMDQADPGSYRTTSPEQAARTILDGIDAGKLHIYVGRDARMMSLLTRIAPRRATHLIYRQMKALLSG